MTSAEVECCRVKYVATSERTTLLITKPHFIVRHVKVTIERSNAIQQILFLASCSAICCPPHAAAV